MGNAIKRYSALLLAGIAILCAAVCVRNIFRISDAIVVSDRDMGADAYLIILGGGTKKGGKGARGSLGESALERLNAAVPYMKQNTDTRAVVSGGRGRYGEAAESTLLKEEMVKCGIAGERIIEEGNSRNTIENLRYSAHSIADDKGCAMEEALKTPVIIVTNGYHLSRAQEIARRLGYSSVAGIAAPTPPLAAARAYIREVLAWVKLDLTAAITGEPSVMCGGSL